MKPELLARGVKPLMAATAFAFVIAFPGLSGAQEPAGSPAPSGETCIQSETGDGCLPIAPASERVDLAEPTFSDPTNITNPLFPISSLSHVIQIGTDAGEPLRAEATVLPDTRTIAWNGQQIETVVSQFVAHIDNKVVEVAIDFFAQADDGSVWYFGEEVVNYEDGVVADTHGTWLAGRDGPPGMIMPGNPQVGDVYRPENIPGFVFEEVTVMAIDQTVDGPRGPVEGAISIQELLMDGTLEAKTFAPGYGEFSAETDSEFLVVALATPMDDSSATMPAELKALSTGASEIFDAVSAGDWEAVSTAETNLTASWDALQATDQPPVIAAQMTDALAALTTAVAAQSSTDARQAALDIGRASLDLQLQYRPLSEVDLSRMALIADQIVVDSAADDAGSVAGDVVVLESIWDRVDISGDSDSANQIQPALTNLRAAADTGDLTAAAEVATRLSDVISQMSSAS